MDPGFQGARTHWNPGSMTLGREPGRTGAAERGAGGALCGWCDGGALGARGGRAGRELQRARGGVAPGMGGGARAGAAAVVVMACSASRRVRILATSWPLAARRATMADG